MSIDVLIDVKLASRGSENLVGKECNSFCLFAAPTKDTWIPFNSWRDSPFITIVNRCQRLREEAKVCLDRQPTHSNQIDITVSVFSHPLTSFTMAANDFRGWVMSAVSGVGKFGGTSINICKTRLTRFHSLRPRSGRHLRRPGVAAGHPPEELPDRQQ